jgi:flavin-binding protein dodecin
LSGAAGTTRLAVRGSVAAPLARHQWRVNAMSVAKIIEISSSSSKGFDDAVQKGLNKISESVKHIKGAWINDMKVVTSDNGKVTDWRVNMRVNFIVD